MAVGGETVGHAYVIIHAEGSGLDAEIKRLLDKAKPTVKKTGEEHGDEYGKSFTGRLRKALDNAGDHFDKFGDRIGRAFGRGARNDFINLMGSMTRNLVRLPGLLATGASSILEFGQGITKAFSEASGGVDGFFKVWGKVGPAVAGAAVGIIGLTAVVGTLTTALELAGGAVIALAGSLSFALVGAVGVAAGALVPLVAGIGTAIIAFVNMDKKAKDAFKGVKDAASGLGDVAAGELFKNIGDSADTLADTLRGLRPLMRSLAGAVRDVFDGWVQGMDSPQFRDFRDFLAATLPDMIRSLGRIGGNLAEIMANIWIQASPHVQTFLNWLEQLTDEWQHFTGMATGQAKIGEFFDHAAESLQRVAGFLDAVIELVGELLSAGRATGDNIFQSMETAIRGWTRALQADPGILRRFFEDAERFADALGDVVVGAGRMIAVLDSPATRDLAVLLGQTLAHSLETVATLLKPVVGLLDMMDDSVAALVITFGTIAFAGFGSKLQTLGTQVQGFIGNMKTAEGRMGALKTAASGLAGAGGLTLLIDASNRTSDKLATLEGAAGGAMAGFSVAGAPGAVIGGVVGGLGHLILNAKRSADAIDASAKAAENASVDYQSLKDSLNQTSGAYTDLSNKAAYQQLIENDAIPVLERFGVTANEAVKGLTGNAHARKEMAGVTQLVTEQNEKLTASLVDQQTEYASLQGNTQSLTAEERARKAELADSIAKTQDQIASNKKFVDTMHDIGVGFAEGRNQIKEQTGALTDWRKVLGRVPDRVRTRLELGNFPTTMKNIKQLFDRYDIAPKRVRTYLEAIGADVSDRKVRKLIQSLKEADKQRADPRVDVDADPPSKKIETIAKKLKETDVFVAKPKVEADDKDFQNKMSDVKKKVDDTNQLHPNVKVTADTAQASNDLDGIKTQVDNLPPSKTINIHTNYTSSGRRPTASGGIFAAPQERLIGEAGPEAVVPLNRPLSQVDPSVRALSAIAQGLVTNMPQATAQRPIELTVVTPTKDPYAVALETINRLAAVGY